MVTYRRSRKPKTYRKRPYRKTTVSKATKKYVKRVVGNIRPEMKHFTSFFDEVNQNTLTGGTVTELANISQGTGVYQRVGNEIRIKGIHIRGVLHSNSGVGTNMMRMLILSHNGDVTNTFATSQWFRDANLAGGSGGVATLNGLNTMYYPINTQRYKVHWDKIYKFGQQTTLEGDDTRVVNKFIKLNSKIDYLADNTSTGNQSKNYILLMFSTESADDIAAGNNIEASLHVRTWFIDS